MKPFLQSIQQAVKKESHFAIGSPALIWQVLFFYLPLALMTLTSFFKLSEEGGFGGFTLQNFTPLFSKSHLAIIFHSLILALTTTLLCVVIAYPLARFIASQKKKTKTLLLFFLIVPFWTNFLLHVYAWFFVLEREGFLNYLLQTLGVIEHPIHFLNSLFAIVLMTLYCYLPFMVLPIFSALERFDPYLLEISYTLGASARQTFTNVMLPLTLPALRAGFLLVFIPIFGEFIIPELMGGDKRYFVGNVVSQYILGDETGGVGAAFMVLSFIALAGAVFLIYLLFKKIEESLRSKIR